MEVPAFFLQIGGRHIRSPRHLYLAAKEIHLVSSTELTGLKVISGADCFLLLLLCLNALFWGEQLLGIKLTTSGLPGRAVLNPVLFG